MDEKSHLKGIPSQAFSYAVTLLANHSHNVQCNTRNSLSHKIIEWFRLEGTLKFTSFQPFCHGQGHLPPDCPSPTLVFRLAGLHKSHLSSPAPLCHCRGGYTPARLQADLAESGGLQAGLRLSDQTLSRCDFSRLPQNQQPP